MALLAGGTTQDIFYANNSAGSFNDTIPVKLSSVTYVEGPRLLISNNNTINIVFYGFNETWDSDIIRLLWVDNSTGSFSQENIISEQEYDQVYPCMVFDSDENVHILYLYGQTGNEDIYYITNASYYPVGVGPPFDPTLLLIIVGVIGGAAAVSAFTFLYRRFKKAERELWEPKLDRDDDISYD